MRPKWDLHIILTGKQESFCQSIAYKEFDFIWEAWAAHYNAKKMSQNTIYQASCRLLANSKVVARIREIEAEIVSKSQSTLDEILIAMSKRVRFDMRTLYDKDGSLLEPHQMTEDQAMCITEFDTKTTYVGNTEEKARVELTKVKLIDLKGLWDMFLKKYGAYITNLNLTNDNLDHLTDLLKDIEE
jgi:phage terminase small subunit